MQWWIDRPRLLGSHNPSHDELRRQRPVMVISLIDRSEGSLGYDPNELGAIRWMEIPVRDFTAPSIDDLERFVKEVDEASGTVIVHCQGGCGRTGTFGAAWLICSRGLSAEEAVAQLRMTNPHAVENLKQMDILRKFEERGSGSL